MKSTLVRWGGTALMIAALAGCGGGGGGTAATTAAPGGTGAAPATPTTPATAAASITAATAVAANDTATTPTAAFAVVQSAGVPPVTINSPPKVNFTVISDGAVVSDLATNTNESARFIIAKLVPGIPATGAAGTGTLDQWQSYTSKAVTPVAGYGPGGKAVLASATQPTTDSGGTLVYNSAGYYTYTFGTDIKDPTKTNGVVYDPNATHRIAIQLSYVNKAGNTVLVNPYFDFTIDANGNAVAVTDPTKDRKMVDITSCNQCHEKLALHGGGRVDTQYCVTCHNAGNTDPYSGNVLDFRIMVHKIHAGNLLQTAYNQDYSVWGYPPATPSQNDFNDVGFPQNLQNCTKCHSSSIKDAAGNVLDPQGDNWKNVPSQEACGACHAGINFKTGGGVTMADAMLGKTSTTIYSGGAHGGGAQADDSKCTLCHDATTIPVYHETTIPSPLNPTVQAGVHAFAYQISGVTIDSSRFVHVDFQILEDGTAVALNAPGAKELITGFSGSPTIGVVYATGQDGIAAPSDWNSGHDAMSLLDALNGVNGNSLTVKDATTNTYTAVVNSSSVGAHSTVHSLALPPDAKMVTALLKDNFTQDGMYTDSTNTTPLPVPGLAAMMAATGNTPDGTPNVARRLIFNESACDTCHDRLGTSPNFHGGNYNIAMCAACHTPNQADGSGWAASSKAWIHAIHGSSQRTNPFTATGSLTSNFSTIGYPGVLKNCTTCHLPGTYDFSAPQYTAKDASGKTIVDNMLYVTAATGSPKASVSAPQAPPVGSGNYAFGATYGCGSTANCQLVVGSATANLFGAAAPKINPATGQLYTYTTEGSNLVTSPIAAACTACHDDAATITHVVTSGYGSFYSPRSTATGVKEQCLFCHGPSGIAGLTISSAHNPATAPW